MTQYKWEESYKVLTVIMENGNKFSIEVNENANALNIMKRGFILSETITIAPVVSNVIEVK